MFRVFVVTEAHRRGCICVFEATSKDSKLAKRRAKALSEPTPLLRHFHTSLAKSMVLILVIG